MLRSMWLFYSSFAPAVAVVRYLVVLRLGLEGLVVFVLARHTRMHGCHSVISAAPNASSTCEAFAAPDGNRRFNKTKNVASHWVIVFCAF